LSIEIKELEEARRDNGLIPERPDNGLNGWRDALSERQMRSTFVVEVAAESGITKSALNPCALRRHRQDRASLIGNVPDAPELSDRTSARRALPVLFRQENRRQVSARPHYRRSQSCDRAVQQIAPGFFA
jgi:hypothetical protein